jgi:hypothetical protein
MCSGESSWLKTYIAYRLPDWGLKIQGKDKITQSAASVSDWGRIADGASSGRGRLPRPKTCTKDLRYPLRTCSGIWRFWNDVSGALFPTLETLLEGSLAGWERSGVVDQYNPWRMRHNRTRPPAELRAIQLSIVWGKVFVS